MAEMKDSLIVSMDDSTDPKSLKHEDQFISRFGSRFSLSLNMTGKEKAIFPVGIGPLEGRLPLFLAVKQGEETVSLPMHYPVFDSTTKPVYDADFSRTMTTAVTRIGRHGGLEIEWQFDSPFYPKDFKLSCVPFFYVTARLRNVSGELVSGTVYAGLEVGDTSEMPEFGGVVKSARPAVNFRPPEYKPGKVFDIEMALAPVGDGSARSRFDTSCAYWECVEFPYSVGAGETVERTFILAMWHEDRDIVEYHGEKCLLKYQSIFDGLEDVVEYAVGNRDEIRRKSALFDSLIEDASITEDQKYCIAKNFHVYLGATWMLERPGGRDLFMNYEGGTGYFSTIDVEYNFGLFYAMFWPELLRSEIEAWTDTYRRGNRLRPHIFGPQHRIMQHDIGGGFVVDEQIYIPGPMPVEENANFLLLNYLYWRFTGSTDAFDYCSDICGDLADYIVESDLNGNGLPNVGVINTLDCFAPLFRNMGDQVFLGLKAAAALAAYRDLLNMSGKGSAATRYADHAGLIFKTVEEQCWDGDHYVVAIHESRPEGWNNATPLALNGIAYLLFTGQTPPLDPERVKKDIMATEQDYTMWPSMGIWRDLVGLYYGHKPAKPYAFRPDFINDFYPRNFDSVGLIAASGGVGMDVPGRTLTYNSSASGRFPLPALADWENEQVPWIEVGDGEVKVVGEVGSFSLVPRHL